MPSDTLRLSAKILFPTRRQWVAPFCEVIIRWKKTVKLILFWTTSKSPSRSREHLGRKGEEEIDGRERCTYSWRDFPRSGRGAGTWSWRVVLRPRFLSERRAISLVRPPGDGTPLCGLWVSGALPFAVPCHPRPRLEAGLADTSLLHSQRVAWRQEAGRPLAGAVR